MVAHWILAQQRSGSTFLCEVLNRTGFFDPHLAEHFTFNEWDLFDESPHLFVNCKIAHPRTLKFIGEKKVARTLPQTRYIKLSRKDTFAKAVSLAYCKKSNIYCVVKEEIKIRKKGGTFECKAAYQNRKRFEFNDREMLEAYYDVLKQEIIGYDSFLEDKPHLAIDFNDLISEPERVVGEVLKFWGFPVDGVEKALRECRIVPMTRPESAEHIERLKELVLKQKIF
jgi:LPS sulfotransferase NodH